MPEDLTIVQEQDVEESVMDPRLNTTSKLSRPSMDESIDRTRIMITPETFPTATKAEVESELAKAIDSPMKQSGQAAEPASFNLDVSPLEPEESPSKVGSLKLVPEVSIVTQIEAKE